MEISTRFLDDTNLHFICKTTEDLGKTFSLNVLGCITCIDVHLQTNL